MHAGNLSLSDIPTPELQSDTPELGGSDTGSAVVHLNQPVMLHFIHVIRHYDSRLLSVMIISGGM